MSVCSRLRDAMRVHRDGARVVADAHLFPAITLIRLFETAMQSLVTDGVKMQKVDLVIMTAVHFVFGNVIEKQSSPSLEEAEQMDFEVFGEDFPLTRESLTKSIEAAKSGYDEFKDALRLIIGYTNPSEQRT